MAGIFHVRQEVRIIQSVKIRFSERLTTTLKAISRLKEVTS